MYWVYLSSSKIITYRYGEIFFFKKKSHLGQKDDHQKIHCTL